MPINRNDMASGPGVDPFEQALAMAAPRPGERVLDLSGRGGMVAFKLGAAGAVVEAMLPTQELADEGRRLAGSLNAANIFFHAGPLHRLPFDPGQFDLVVWCLGLATEARPLAALAEVARVLGKGGRLVLQEALAFQHPPLDLRIWELERLRNPNHRLYYTRQEMHDLLNSSGLKVLDEEPGTLTQDFGYWADASGLSTEETGQVWQTFFALPPADQDRIDLALSDRRISFAYPIVTILASPR